MNQIMMLASILKLTAQVLRDAVEVSGREFERLGLDEEFQGMRVAYGMLTKAKEKTDKANAIFIGIAAKNLEEPDDGPDV